MSVKLRYGLLLLVLVLSGCSKSWEATKKVGKVLWDPDIPVGKANQQPSEIAITLLAEPDMNPNPDGEPSPVEMQLVYLSEDSRFESMDFDQLDDKPLPDVLGKNYIDHQDYTLTPDQYKPLALLRTSGENRYLGVIVRYSDPNVTEWKKIIRLSGIGRQYYILVHVRANEVELLKEEEE